MKATMSRLNCYLIDRLPQYRIVKGHGYFYFTWADDAPDDTPEPPESLFVNSLNQMNYKSWIAAIDSHVQQWERKQENLLKTQY